VPSVANFLAVGILATLVNFPPAGPDRPPSPAPRPKVNPTPAMPPDSPVAPAVRAAREGDFELAARLLRSVEPRLLVPAEARRWRLSAVDAAVRTGDRALLEQATRGGEGALFAEGRLILHAWEYAQIGQHKLAKATLRKIPDPERLDERSRRRYLALLAGIAEQEGDRKTERAFVAKLVDYLGAWRTPTCQQCHENPEKYGDDVTSIDVANHWFGKRFSAILAADGDASRIVAQSRRELAKDPNDERARLRLGYALRAEGRQSEADAVLSAIEWGGYPDKPFKQPDNDIVFPGKLPLPLAKRRPLQSFEPDNHVVSAADFLRANQFDRARRELAEIAPFNALSPRDRFRALAVEARLAHLERNVGAERHALEAMVEMLESIPVANGASYRLDDRWWVARRLRALGVPFERRDIATQPVGLRPHDLERFP